MPATAKVSSKLRYTDHPAFASHTPAQWVEIVNHAIVIRENYTGPRTNMAAHIDSVIAGARAPAPVLKGSHQHAAMVAKQGLTIHTGKRVVRAVEMDLGDGRSCIVPAFLVGK